MIILLDMGNSLAGARGRIPTPAKGASGSRAARRWGWGFTENGNGDNGSAAVLRRSLVRSRNEARASDAIAMASAETGAGDPGIATLKLGGLCLVANRGAPHRAPTARMDRAFRPQTPQTSDAGKAAERALSAPARQIVSVRPSSQHRPLRRGNREPITRKRPKCDNVLHRRRRLAWQANSRPWRARRPRAKTLRAVLTHRAEGARAGRDLLRELASSFVNRS